MLIVMLCILPKSRFNQVTHFFCPEISNLKRHIVVICTECKSLEYILFALLLIDLKTAILYDFQKFLIKSDKNVHLFSI